MAVTLDVATLKKQVMVVEGVRTTSGVYAKQSFDDAFWTAKLEVGKALVERYAPDAPEAVQNEACLRVISYLYDRSPANQSRRVDSVDVMQAPGHLGAMLHSGAKGLLSPWKVRRAGAI